MASDSLPDDVVSRLRERSGKYDEYDWHSAIELEAADEIERLRTIVRSVERIALKPCSYKERVTRITFALNGLTGPQVTA